MSYKAQVCISAHGSTPKHNKAKQNLCACYLWGKK